MAVVSFSNVKTATVNTETVNELTSADFAMSANVSAQSVDGNAYSSVQNQGGKTISCTLNGLDPGLTASGLLKAVLSTAGGLKFSMTKTIDDTGATDVIVCDGTPEIAVGESWEFDSGGPGETGTASAGFQIVGLLDAGLGGWQGALIPD